MKGDDMDRMPPPLPAAIEALLVHERVPPVQPEVTRARAFARARAAPGEPGTAALSPRGAGPRVRRLLFAAAAGLALVAGVAAAFQVMRRPSSSRPAPPATTDSPAPSAPPAIGAPSTEPEAAEPTDVRSPLAVARTRRTIPSGKHEGGPEEIQLLSRARASDVRGDYPDVLAILAEHERSHPAGRLTEEREVLRVKALVALGRGSEARRAGASFRRQFPRSVLLRTVDEILASLP